MRFLNAAFTPYAAVISLVFVSLTAVAKSDEAIKLDASYFEAIEPMGMSSSREKYPEWQKISIGFRDSVPSQFLFPVRAIVARVVAKPPSGKSRTPAIDFDQVEVGLFRSTSNFSLIYNVQVTLKGADGKEWFFIAGFRGKRGRDYLKSTELQQQIGGAIVECLRGIDRTGGFSP